MLPLIVKLAGCCQGFPRWRYGVIVLVVASVPSSLHPQTIETVAGNGTRTDFIDGLGGDPTDDLLDGSAAVAASLNHPTGVAIDGAGNLFITDHSNYRPAR